MRKAAVLVALIAITATAAAQQPTFRSNTGAVVSIFATVLDRDNRLVPDLTREDFEVLDNDQPQNLVLFENETRPITAVVMLDTSFSMTSNLKFLKEAAEQFVIRLLPDDKAKVGAFNDKIEFGGHFTNDRDELVSDLRGLDYGNATRLFDAASMSLDELSGVEGRRVLVLLSDGEDTGSRASFRSVMDRARNEDVMIYSIGLSSEYFDGVRVVRSKPDGAMRRFAEETGGGYFELKRTSELASTFTRVAQELHSQYALAFVAPKLDNKVHRLTVRLKQPGMTARARRSYLASADDSSSER
jgi:Ca-activated chloride channel family protein